MRDVWLIKSINLPEPQFHIDIKNSSNWKSKTAEITDEVWDHCIPKPFTNILFIAF